MEANRESGYPFVPPFSPYSSSLEYSHVGIRRGLQEGAAVSWSSGTGVPLPGFSPSLAEMKAHYKRREACFSMRRAECYSALVQRTRDGAGKDGRGGHG